MPYRPSYRNSQRMTPAQRAAKARYTYKPKTYRTSARPTADSTRTTVRRAPTIGGTSVNTSLLTKTPLFPIRKYIKSQLYYEAGLTKTASIGGIATYIFSANGIYDPNVTGTGHQPIGFDQMMTLYEQYTTIRSHIKVSFYNASTEAARVAVYLSPDTTIPSITAVMENGLVKSKVISGDSGAGSHRQVDIDLTCDIPKYFGKSYQSILAEADMAGTIASNPVEQVYFVIAVWNPYGSDDSTVGFDVTLSYDSMYWEPKKLTSS